LIAHYCKANVHQEGMTKKNINVIFSIVSSTKKKKERKFKYMLTKSNREKNLFKALKKKKKKEKKNKNTKWSYFFYRLGRKYTSKLY